MTGRMRLTRRAAVQGAAMLPLLATAGCAGFWDTLFTSHKKGLPGKREDVVPVTEGLVPPAERPVVGLPPPLVGDWAVEGGALSHAAGNAALPLKQLHEVWHTRMGESSSYRRQSTASPLVVGDTVFTMDAAGMVEAFSAVDGKRLWQRPTKPKHAMTTNIGGGIGFGGGTLFATTGYSQLWALDPANGTPRFVHTFNVPIRSAPTPVNGAVYFVTVDEVLVAASANDGHQLWSYEATASDTTLLGHPAPAYSDGFVVAGFGSGDLVACNAASGAVAWSDSIAASTGQAGVAQLTAISGRPVIVDGIAVAISTGGLMVGEDLRAGRRLWEREVSGHISPVAAGHFVFATSNDDQVFALLARTGEVAWLSDLPHYKRPKTKGAPLTWTGCVLANDVLFFTGLQGRIQLVDAVNGVIGPFIAVRGAVSLPPVVARGTLFVITDDGVLRAFQ